MNQNIIEVIESYNSYLKKIPNGCDQISNFLRKNDTIQEGLGLILDFSEGVAWLIQVNQLLAQNGISNKLDISIIQEYLEEINSSLEIEDYYSVADLFEYEIKPFFENCKCYTM